MVYSLVLFDGLALAREGGSIPPAALQRRRLALLAVLALGGDRGVSRDVVQAYLWPESAPDRARHALDQLLYATRRDLGRDAVLSGAGELRLNPDVLDVDVWRFERALRAGRPADAVALRPGPLLHGVHLAEAAAAEHWIDEERARLERLFHGALEQLAAAAAADGDPPSAAHWWRRRAAAEPLSAPVTLSLMRALAAAGDRATAVQHARVYARLVETELGVAADPAVAALAAALAAAPAAAPAVAPASPIPSPDCPPAALPAVTPADPPASAAAAGSAAAIPAAAPRTSWSRRGRGAPLRWRAAVGGLLVAVVAGAIAATRYVPARAAVISSGTIAVLPFRATGGPDAAALADGMPVLLSTNLNGAGELRGVDPRALLAFVAQQGGAAPAADPALGRRVATHFGAGRFVLGDVVEAGGRLRITAALYERTRTGQPAVQATVEGTPAEFFALVDRLTARLVADLQAGPNARLARIATVTTASFPALKAYLQGERAMRLGRYGDAVGAFQQAVAEDTTFALAYYRLAMATTWSDAAVPGSEPARRAVRHAARLTERDRMLLEAFQAEWLGDGETAERHYRAILARHPDDVETWFRLGEVLFHNGPLFGRPVAMAAEAFGRAAALDPANAEAVIHLARLAALDGRDAAFDSLAARHRTLVGGATGQAWELHAVAAMRRGPAAAATLAGELREATVSRRYSAVRNAAVYGIDLAAAARLARSITDYDASPETRALGSVLEAYLAVARGRLDDARMALRRARAIDPLLAAEHGGLLAAAPFLPEAPLLFDAARDAETWRARIERADGHPAAHDAPSLAIHHAVHAHVRLAALGLAAAARGDTAAAAAIAEDASVLPGVDRVPSLSADVTTSVRARAAHQAGRPELALRLLETAPVHAPVEYANYSPLYARAHDRFLRAELLLAAGRDREALGWYAAFGGDSFFDLPYLAPAQRRLGEIRLRMADTARARLHFQRFAALWAEADAPLQPAVADARSRLATMAQ